MQTSADTDPPRRVLAIAAHPDDIEFMMGGTLALLAERGWEAHYLAMASGNLGSLTQPPEELVLTRSRESEAGALALGAIWHPSLVHDAEIIYSTDVLRRVTAVVRSVRPRIVLTQAPDDYMEDHTETSRLAAAAAFNRNMPNFPTSPPEPSYPGDVTVYHALPHGLRDQLRRLVFPELFVDVHAVRDRKRAALAAHRSQEPWLVGVQGFASPADTMDEMAYAVGSMSERFEYAEGWRRHSHLGFSVADGDPLAEALCEVCHVDDDYRRALDRNPLRAPRTQ